MSITTADKASRFAALHKGPATFVMPNAFDAGTAQILAQLGFEALATSSAACAQALGRRDGEITRDEAIAHARAIVAATDLPVSGDLENGFGHAIADVTLTIRLAGEIGLAGGSIEDATGDAARPIYAFGESVERVAAAVEAARALGQPFTLTARAENFIRGRADLDDTIRRLQAYEKAGADVLFAPALPDLDAVRTVCASLTKPFSFMAGIKGKSFSVPELHDAGVRRVSTATALYRAAMAGLRDAAREVREKGTFTFLDKL